MSVNFQRKTLFFVYHFIIWKENVNDATAESGEIELVKENNRMFHTLTLLIRNKQPFYIIVLM